MPKYLPVLLSAALLLAGCKADAGAHAASSADKTASARVPGPAADPAPTGPASAPTGITASPSGNGAQPAVHDPRPVLVCFGDSLTAGFGAAEGSSYPDFLQADLDQAGFHYRVVNEGVSGDTTKDGLDRLPDVIALHPAVVVLEFGGNDGLRGLKVETTRQNLASLIQGLQTAGVRVVLAGITLPPDYGPDYIHSFTANYTALARQFHTPLLPFLLQNVYDVPGMMQADQTHATERGNSVVARNVMPYVRPLLKK